MNEVVVGRPRIKKAIDGRDVSVHVDLAGSGFELQYGTAADPLNLSAEPFLATALIPSMKLGLPLRLSGPVSPRLMAATVLIQERLHGFFPELHPIEIMAETAASPMPDSDRKVACFFSGGMDSFYTVLKHREEIDALIFVHGFDIRLADQDVWNRVEPSIRAAATELGKPLIEVRTNVQAFTDPYLHWNFTCGSAMASVALLLSPLFKKIYVPASWTYAQLFPWGTHPVLDPLWSTEALEIVHDGCEATRVDKAALIATSDTALNYLRVCYQNRQLELGSVYNCGECEKCLRTKINLYLVGALDRCATFDHTLDFQAVSRMQIHLPEARAFVADNLEAAERLDADPGLIRALRDALTSSMSADELHTAIGDANAKVTHLEEENSALRMRVRAVLESRSWRLSKPLRTLGDMVRKLKLWNAK